MAPLAVTVTLTVPLPAGEVAVHKMDDEHVTPVATTEPKSTVVAPEVVEKPVPLIVTLVPPPVVPAVGEMELTVGAAVVGAL